MKQLLLLVSLIFISFSASAEKIGVTRYTLGGVTGTIIGFGLGHAIQGRWISDNGWIFTAGESVSFLLIAGNTKTSCLNPSCTISVTTQSSNADAALAAFAVFRIWQIIDVWWLPKNMNVGVWPAQDKQPKLYFSYNF